MKAIAVTAGALALSAIAANAEPLPQPKPPGPGGSCPHGKTRSPSRRTAIARGAICRQGITACGAAT